MFCEMDQSFTPPPLTKSTSTKAPEVFDAPDEGFALGVTVDQIDALNRLVRTISAQGDVVACSRAAGLDNNTLPRVGQAIYEGMEAARAILHQVEAQQLAPRIPLNRVGEERAVYDVGFVSPNVDDVPASATDFRLCVCRTVAPHVPALIQMVEPM